MTTIIQSTEEAPLKVLSFGGGVQTYALALMCLKGDYERPDLAVFADPGWETQGTYEIITLTKMMFEEAGIPFEVVSKGNLRDDALNPNARFASMPLWTIKDGKKGILRRQCTNEYKIQPVIQAIRRFCNIERQKRMKRQVSLWLGISVDEASRMKPNRLPWATNIYPLIERGMSRQSCKQYITGLGLPLPPKSACIGCPYHSDSFWRALKKDSPEEFQDAVEFDEAVRKTRVAIKSPVFIHRSAKPLAEVNLDREPDLFEEECEGMCGL